MAFAPSRRGIAAALLAASCATAPAFAQFVWLDSNGIKQYSDRPPPASVPASRILKQPGGAAPSEPDAVPASAPSKAPPTIAEREADFRRRHAEQAEKDKKAAEQARLARENAQNCERARDYRSTLESGERIVRTDKNGERVFLTDEQRAQELREAQQMLKDCK